jgi:hypothetical protein
MAWEVTEAKVVNTPKGDYKATSNDLKAEIIKAATFAGLNGAKFRVFIDGVEIPGAGSLPTNDFAALTQSVRIAAYDVAGC